MLTQIEQRLCDAAISARHNAYAPYSKFKVGAAILDEFDNIHLGVNVENAAYPQGSCGEACGISAMIAAGGTKIRGIAVRGAGRGVCSPCGGCRQRIREFANVKTDILICTDSQFKKRFNLEMLLPASFGPDNLV